MNMQRYVTLSTTLEQIVHILVINYRPEKIILFGSMAQPDVGEWSDLDLVIVKETSLPFMRRLKEVALLCLAPVSVDFLVYTPSEFAELVAQKNPFILNEVVAKGRVLYEHQPTPAMV
jgi:predicted nucleotidyltransferase